MRSRCSAVSINKSAFPMYADIAQIRIRRAALEDPVLGPQPWVAQEVDHDARIASVRRRERHAQFVAILPHGVLVQTPATEHLLSLRAVQPRDETLVLRIVAWFEVPIPCTAILLRLHATSVSQSRSPAARRYPVPDTPDTWPEPRR